MLYDFESCVVVLFGVVSRIVVPYSVAFCCTVLCRVVLQYAVLSREEL